MLDTMNGSESSIYQFRKDSYFPQIFGLVEMILDKENLELLESRNIIEGSRKEGIIFWQFFGTI